MVTMTARLWDTHQGVCFRCDNCNEILMWVFDHDNSIGLDVLNKRIAEHRIDDCTRIDDPYMPEGGRDNVED
jgi:hypothetical protein